MDAAIARAIAGKSVDLVSKGVEKAKGVDKHVEEHQANRR